MTSTKLSVRTTDLVVAQAISDALEASRAGPRCRHAVRGRRRRLAGGSLFARPRRGRGRRRGAAHAVSASRSPISSWRICPTSTGWPSRRPPCRRSSPAASSCTAAMTAGASPTARAPSWSTPGEAFGTAHHGTTLGCLLAIDKLARAGSYAPGARSRLRLGRAGDRRSTRHARGAGHRHRFRSRSPSRWRAPTPTPTARGRIATACALGLDHPWLRHAAPFDLIIANILAGPLRMLAGDVSKSASPRRQRHFVGHPQPGGGSGDCRLRRPWLRVVQHRRIGEWSTLTLRKRR